MPPLPFNPAILLLLALIAGIAAGYVHFRVQIDGRMYHRLAQIAAAGQTDAPRCPAKMLPALPLFEPRQEEDWLP